MSLVFWNDFANLEFLAGLYNGSLFYSNHNRVLSSVSPLRFFSGLQLSGFCVAIKLQTFCSAIAITQITHESHEYLYNVLVARVHGPLTGVTRSF